MSLTVGILYVVGGLLALLVAGVPFAFSMGMVGIIGLFVVGGTGMLSAIGQIAWWNLTSFILIAVPLFIFMGEVIMQAGMSSDLYRAFGKWTSRLPGGMAVGGIAACTLFSAISGSSTACAATIGVAAIPEMERRGYDRKLIFGSLAAGGTLGILIPPSIPMIVYGAMTGQSVGTLFIAGILPGLMLAGLFSLYIVVAAARKPGIAPSLGRVTWWERLVALKGVAPSALLIIVILGGIYTGIVTPTESAAVGCVASLVLALVGRRLNWNIMRQSLLATVQTCGMVFMIFIGAQIMSYFLSSTRLPQQVGEIILSRDMSPWMVFMFVAVMYIIMGCFIDGLSMMLMTISTVFPIMTQAGFDPVWFGIVMVILIEIGLLTPPVGINLFVIQGISGGRPLGEVVAGAIPFVGLQLIGLALITVFPAIALWLPSMMMK